MEEGIYTDLAIYVKQKKDGKRDVENRPLGDSFESPVLVNVSWEYDRSLSINNTGIGRVDLETRSKVQCQFECKIGDKLYQGDDVTMDEPEGDNQIKRVERVRVIVEGVENKMILAYV